MIVLKEVGFLGPRGTFSEEAFKIFYKNEKVDAVEYITISDVIVGLEKDQIEEAIVPIENSIEGSVGVTLDMISTRDLFIVNEFVMPIKLFLLAKAGTNINNITSIYSHPQPIGQCRLYLDKNFNGANIVSTESTTQGAKVVSQGEHGLAVIGPKNMADIYNLEIINENIEDNSNNQTRFVILSKKSNKDTGDNCKISIVFAAEDKPGSLYKILNIFSLWDINLTKIESRPQKEKLGQYIFFVDIEGNITNQDTIDALTMVRRKTTYYKFLGSYPRHQ